MRNVAKTKLNVYSLISSGSLRAAEAVAAGAEVGAPEDGEVGGGLVSEVIAVPDEMTIPVAKRPSQYPTVPVPSDRPTEIDALSCSECHGTASQRIVVPGKESYFVLCGRCQREQG